jgi:hypothetical protein
VARRSLIAVALFLPLLAGTLVTARPAAASALVTTRPAAVTATGLTPGRNCDNILTGDRLRMLSVCARGYVGALYTYGVVEMHTYRWLSVCPNLVGDAATSPGCWLDSTSQSITLNIAELGHHHTSGSTIDWWWGNDMAMSHRCQVDSIGGRTACSVANTVRVAYYSAPFADDHCGALWWTSVWKVSWRDDRGQAHYYDFGSTTQNPPYGAPLDYGWVTG